LKHLSEIQIAAFVDNKLTKDERNNLIKHILECEKCYNDILETFLLLGKKPDIGFSELDDKIKKKALSFGANNGDSINKSKSAFGNYKISISFALALIIVFTVVILNVDTSKKEKQFRDNNTSKYVNIISPNEGDIIENENVSFSWDKIDSALLYRVRIYEESGNVLFDTSINKNNIKVPIKIKVKENEKYFWDVQANFSNGNVITSKLNVFTTK